MMERPMLQAVIEEIKDWSDDDLMRLMNIVDRAKLDSDWFIGLSSYCALKLDREVKA